MSADDLLKDIYTRFYEQKEVLTDAPALTQDPNGETFDISLADKELAKLISWMMGVEDIQKENFEQAVKIIQGHYASQPEWQELLVHYFDYTLQREKETLKAQEDALIQEIEEFTKKLLAEG